jgi:hypothetical protein
MVTSSIDLWCSESKPLVQVSGYEALPSSSNSSELLPPKKITSPASFALSADGTGYSYAYGPKGIQGLINNYTSFGFVAFASIGYFSYWL